MVSFMIQHGFKHATTLISVLKKDISCASKALAGITTPTNHGFNAILSNANVYLVAKLESVLQASV